MRKFYKQTYKIIVLTEEPGEIKLEDLSYEVTEGHSVLHTFNFKEKEIKPKTMVKLLYDAGSEPGFFELNDNGEPKI